MSESGVSASYERIAERFAPVQDELDERSRRARRTVCSTSRPAPARSRCAPRGRAATVTAIDIAEPMIEKARRRAEEEGVQVSFDLGDVEYLPYDDERSTSSPRTSA